MPLPAAALIPIVIAGAQTVFRMVAPTIAKKLIKEGIAKKLPASAVKNAKKIPRASEKQVRDLADKAGKPGGRDIKVRQKTEEQRLGDAWQKTGTPKKPPLSKTRMVDRSKPKDPDEVLNTAWTKGAGAVRKRLIEKKPPKKGKIKPPPKSKKPLTAKQKAILAGIATAGGAGGLAVLNKKDKDKLPPLEKKGYVDTIPKPKAVVHKEPKNGKSKIKGKISSVKKVFKKGKALKSKGVDTDDFSDEREAYTSLYNKNGDKHWREIKKASKALGLKYMVPKLDEHGMSTDPDMLEAELTSDSKGGLIGRPRKTTKVKIKKKAASKPKRKTSSTRKRKGFGGRGQGAALRGF